MNSFDWIAFAVMYVTALVLLVGLLITWCSFKCKQEWFW